MASGAIGTQHVAQSAPDGHTLLLIAAPFTTVAAVLPQAGYDPVRGFAPISMVAQGPLLWACQKDLPVANLRELIDYARSRPGRLNYGSAGAGGINHLALEGLKARTGVFITHIPYRGIAPATQDLLAGQLDLITGTIPALASFVRDGCIKALAVTTGRRTPALPDVPSMSESGLAGFDVNNYFGLVAPRGTPQAVADRINEVLPRVLALPDVQARFKTDALEPASLGAAAQANFLAQDFGSWQKVVAAQGIKVDSVCAGRLGRLRGASAQDRSPAADNEGSAWPRGALAASFHFETVHAPFVSAVGPALVFAGRGERTGSDPA